MRLLGLIDIVSAAVPRFNYTWPPQVLAPYCDVLLWPPYDLTAAFAATNVNHYTLGFITADTRGFASWGGSRPISSNWFGDQIQSIRSNGGEVIISFGGAAGIY